MRTPAFDLPLMLVDVRIVARDVTILDQISLKLEAGPPTVLIGPNGAGKTTLLRATMGLIPATSGLITWGGREVSAPTRRAIMFQRPAMLRRSAAGNLRYALAAAKVPRAQREARVRRADGRGRADGPRAPAGAAAVRRRAAAAGAGARLRARSRRAVPRRTDRQPRPRRHQGDRGHRAQRSQPAASRW